MQFPQMEKKNEKFHVFLMHGEVIVRPLLIVRFEISGQSSPRLLIADRETPHDSHVGASHGVELSFQLNFEF